MAAPSGSSALNAIAGVSPGRHSVRRTAAQQRVTEAGDSPPFDARTAPAEHATLPASHSLPQPLYGVLGLPPAERRPVESFVGRPIHLSVGHRGGVRRAGVRCRRGLQLALPFLRRGHRSVHGLTRFPQRPFRIGSMPYPDGYPRRPVEEPTMIARRLAPRPQSMARREIVASRCSRRAHWRAGGTSPRWPRPRLVSSVGQSECQSSRGKNHVLLSHVNASADAPRSSRMSRKSSPYSLLVFSIIRLMARDASARLAGSESCTCFRYR